MSTKLSALGLIGALDEEIEHLLLLLEDHSTEEHAGIRFYKGMIDAVPVVLCKSGVGKVNAAICTQLLIDKFSVDAVWFTGVAGALDPRLSIGDIVISTECLHHDVDASSLGFSPGTIPYDPLSVFPAEETFVKAAEAAGAAIEGSKVFKGRVVSGDQFIADVSRVRQLYEQFNGMCTEMEGAAVAQVCCKNAIPFVIIRSMSDRADGSANENFAEFTKLAAAQSYQMVRTMLHQI